MTTSGRESTSGVDAAELQKQTALATLNKELGPLFPFLDQLSQYYQTIVREHYVLDHRGRPPLPQEVKDLLKLGQEIIKSKFTELFNQLGNEQGFASVCIQQGLTHQTAATVVYDIVKGSVDQRPPVAVTPLIVGYRYSLAWLHRFLRDGNGAPFSESGFMANFPCSYQHENFTQDDGSTWKRYVLTFQTSSGAAIQVSDIIEYFQTMACAHTNSKFGSVEVYTQHDGYAVVFLDLNLEPLTETSPTYNMPETGNPGLVPRGGGVQLDQGCLLQLGFFNSPHFASGDTDMINAEAVAFYTQMVGFRDELIPKLIELLTHNRTFNRERIIDRLSAIIDHEMKTHSIANIGAQTRRMLLIIERSLPKILKANEQAKSTEVTPGETPFDLCGEDLNQTLTPAIRSSVGNATTTEELITILAPSLAVLLGDNDYKNHPVFQTLRAGENEVIEELKELLSDEALKSTDEFLYDQDFSKISHFILLLRELKRTKLKDATPSTLTDTELSNLEKVLAEAKNIGRTPEYHQEFLSRILGAYIEIMAQLGDRLQIVWPYAQLNAVRNVLQHVEPMLKQRIQLHVPPITYVDETGNTIQVYGNFTNEAPIPAIYGIPRYLEILCLMFIQNAIAINSAKESNTDTVKKLNVLITMKTLNKQTLEIRISLQGDIDNPLDTPNEDTLDNLNNPLSDGFTQSRTGGGGKGMTYIKQFLADAYGADPYSEEGMKEARRLFQMHGITPDDGGGVTITLNVPVVIVGKPHAASTTAIALGE